MAETIERAAIRFRGEVIDTPRPGRHCTIFMYSIYPVMTDDDECVHPEDQGFVTSTGRFVGRQEAMEIARAANQLIHEPYQPNCLFSEDVW